MERHTWTRGLSRLGLVAAALASIATSQPDWGLEDSVAVSEIRLDTNQPEDVRHYSVSSSQHHSISVVGHIHWDETIANPAAAVRVRIVDDSGSLLREEIERVQDSVDEGQLQEGRIHVGATAPCASAPCDAGYTVSIGLVDGQPDESVRVDVRVVAGISGTGSSEPDNAFVTIHED